MVELIPSETKAGAGVQEVLPRNQKAAAASTNIPSYQRHKEKRDHSHRFSFSLPSCASQLQRRSKARPFCCCLFIVNQKCNQDAKNNTQTICTRTISPRVQWGQVAQGLNSGWSKPRRDNLALGNFSPSTFFFSTLLKLLLATKQSEKRKSGSNVLSAREGIS